MLGRLLVFISGLLVVALFAALIAPYFVDWTNFRQDFEKQASLILGKKVVVHGDVSARLIPFPSVTLTDVRVAQPGEPEPLVQVERFSMDMELAPFLSGEARIFEMRIQKPVVRLALQEDGTLDWIRSGSPAIPAKTVVLENIRVSDGTLTFEDRQTGRTRTLTNLDMTASAKSLQGPWRFEGEGALDGVNGGFAATTGSYEGGGELRLSTHIRPADTPVDIDLDGALKMEELRLRYRGNFVASYRAANADAEESRRGPRATGSFELANDAIRLPEYRLEVGDPEDPYVIEGEAALDTGLKPEFLLRADGQQVDISRIGGGEDSRTSRSADISGASRLKALLTVIADIPIPTVPGRASIHLPSILAGDTTYRNLVIEAQPDTNGWKIDKATAELPGRTVLEASGDLQVKGGFGFVGQLTTASNQPSGLASWLAGRVDPAIRGLNQAGFSALVNLGPDLQRFENIELALGGDILRGRAERQSPDEGAPSVSVNLAGGELDIDAFYALSALIFGGDAASTALDHSIAAKLDLKALKAFGTVAENFSTVFSMADGKLDLGRLAIGSVAGATVELHGSIEGSVDEPRFSLEGSLVAGDAAETLAYLQSRLPAHPVLRRANENSAFFSDADLRFTLSSGDDTAWPVQASVEGNIDGTRVAGKFSSEIWGITPQSGFSLDISGENGDATTLLGQLGFQPLPIEATSGGIAGLSVSRQGGADAEIRLSLTADDGSLQITGTGDAGADHFLDGSYAITLESDDLEPYLLMNGVSIPQMGAGLPLQFAAGLSITPEAFVVSGLSGKADINVFSGELSLSRASQPKLSGSLAVETFDLAWLVESVTGPLTDVEGGLSQAPMVTPGEGPFRAEIALKADQFWAGYQQPLTEFAGTLTYDGRSTGFQDAEGRFAGGKATGSFSIANADGQAFLTTQFDVKNANFRRLSWEKDGEAVLAGDTDFSALLEASGRSAEELAQQFSGSGVVAFKTLTVDGLDLTVLPQILEKADAIEGDVTAEKVQPLAEAIHGNGPTEFSDVQVPFSVAGSVFRIGNVAAETDNAAISLDGEGDIAAGTLDTELRIAFKPGDEALAGAEPALTVLIGGALTDPTAQTDVSELTGYLSLRAFERERRRVELLQANILEKQRLRREAAYFKSLADQREAARLKAEEEERQRLEEERRRQEEEARAREAARQAEVENETADPGSLPSLNLDPNTVIRGTELPAPNQ